MDKVTKCPECGEPIRGRTDKKFCSDMCRNSFNNKLNSSSNNYVRNVNNILRKNRRVIEESMNNADTAKTTRNKLQEKGFNFNFHTDTYTTKKGATYIFCYDLGYLPLENDYFFLVKKRESPTEKH
jgi:hypothetical protein